MSTEIEEAKGSTHVGRTTKNDSYETPPELFRLIDDVFDFEVDLAASAGNALCNNFCSEEESFLGNNFCSEEESFLGEHGLYAGGMRAWLNPPFSLKEAFLARAVELRNHFPVIVCIVPWTSAAEERAKCMGMFDCIDFETACPKCGSRVVGFQSKDGPCELLTLTPLMVDRFYSSCHKCLTWLEYHRPRKATLPPEVGCMEDFALDVSSLKENDRTE